MRHGAPQIILSLLALVVATQGHRVRHHSPLGRAMRVHTPAAYRPPRNGLQWVPRELQESAPAPGSDNGGGGIEPLMPPEQVPPMPPSPPPDDGGSDTNVGLIAGVVAGVVALAVAVVLAVVVLKKRSRGQKKKKQADRYRKDSDYMAGHPPGAPPPGYARSQYTGSQYGSSAMPPYYDEAHFHSMDSRAGSAPYTTQGVQSVPSAHPSYGVQSAMSGGAAGQAGKGGGDWTYMSWTNTTSSGAGSAFFMPVGPLASRDIASAAEQYLTTRPARFATVVAGPRASDTTDMPSWTVTQSSEDMQPSTLLGRQLDWLESHSNGVLLRKYKLLGKAQRRQGGQGLVAFAADRFTDGLTYAIKFYFSDAAFSREREILTNATLRRAMPACQDVVDDAQSRTLSQTERGPILLPPMIITERGESLNEYVRRKAPDFVTSMQVMVHIAEKLQVMHNAGWVHRDLKPGNAIWLPSQNTWSLIDFGCTAAQGSECALSFSLLYAAPETVAAFREGKRNVVADVSVDMFAFGIMCFELFTKQPYYGADPNGADVCEMLEGSRPMPHEVMTDETARKLGSQRKCASSFDSGIILRMLSRDPQSRGTISEILRAVQAIFGVNTMDFSS